MKNVGLDAWIVGDVVKGENKSVILENSKIIEVWSWLNKETFKNSKLKIINDIFSLNLIYENIDSYSYFLFWKNVS